MKKQLICLTFCIILTLAATMKIGHAEASMESSYKLAFLLAVDEQLKSSELYDKGSVTLIDGFNFAGEIIKVVKPKTATSEEVTEEYTSQLAVGFVEYDEMRDSIFTFKTTAFYYYDLENKEFLNSNQVFINNEIKTFFDQYKFDIKKQSTVGSQIILMLLISFILTVPILIIIFHNKGRSTVVNRFQYEFKSGA